MATTQRKSRQRVTMTASRRNGEGGSLIQGIHNSLAGNTLLAQPMLA